MIKLCALVKGLYQGLRLFVWKTSLAYGLGLFT